MAETWLEQQWEGKGRIMKKQGDQHWSVNFSVMVVPLLLIHNTHTVGMNHSVIFSPADSNGLPKTANTTSWLSRIFVTLDTVGRFWDALSSQSLGWGNYILNDLVLHYHTIGPVKSHTFGTRFMHYGMNTSGWKSCMWERPWFFELLLRIQHYNICCYFPLHYTEYLIDVLNLHSAVWLISSTTTHYSS